MGTPKNTKNIGGYWGIKLKYSEDEIIKWVNTLNSQSYHTLFSDKVYNKRRGFISVVSRKLDGPSKSLFLFYFRKIHLKNNNCTYCGCDISKSFILTFKCGLKHLPKWCMEHYKDKKWLENNGKHSVEANLKRSAKRKIFLQTDAGREYCKNVGEKNKINTKLWRSKLTYEEKESMNLKSSKSQIKNILEGKFNPQKNYKHYRKNTCYLNGREYVFRSSWEVIFFISNPMLKYETLGIKYLKNNGKDGIYIPDFIDGENKIIYELKPRRNYIKQQIKMDGAIWWCLENNYKFIWINEDNLLSYINESDNVDYRNNKFYIKAYKGLNEQIKNKVNKENRK